MVIHKGDRLMGHITEVESNTSGSSGSWLGIAFNQLVEGGTKSSLNAVVTSVIADEVQTRNSGSLYDESEPMTPLAAPSSAGRASGGGGLMGTVGSAANSTAGVTSSAVGSVATTAAASVGAAGSTLGHVGGAIQPTTQTSAGNSSGVGLATPARAIHLSSQAQASQLSSVTSVFSTRKGNLRLDSGTRLEFKVAASGDVQARGH